MAPHPDGLLAHVHASGRCEPPYELLALRYGTALTTRSSTFMGAEHDVPWRMDYYLWVIRNERRTIVVDTGFEPTAARRRGHECVIEPMRALVRVGVQPYAVRQLILTHLHYDHTGNLGSFPRATIYVHQRELDHWREPRRDGAPDAELVAPADLRTLAAAAHAGRLRTQTGAIAEIAPGVLAVRTGGHTPGQTIVIVNNTGGTPIVLASDAAHFYEEIESERAFTTHTDLGELRSSYRLLYELSARGAQLLAGHDPSVLARFPGLSGQPACFGVHLGGGTRRVNGSANAVPHTERTYAAGGILASPGK